MIIIPITFCHSIGLSSIVLIIFFKPWSMVIGSHKALTAYWREIHIIITIITIIKNDSGAAGTVELAVTVGRPQRCQSTDDVRGYIFLFSIFNIFIVPLTTRSASLLQCCYYCCRPCLPTTSEWYFLHLQSTTTAYHCTTLLLPSIAADPIQQLLPLLRC